MGYHRLGIQLDNVEPHIHVLYGVWVPTKGWAGPYKHNSYGFTKEPRFWKRHGAAKKKAAEVSGQLIAFDLVPTLRSWPNLEAPVTD